MSGRRHSRAANAALLTTVVGLSLSLAALWLQPARLLAAWLPAALFVLGLPLGAMTLLLAHMLTGGGWGDAVKPSLRAMLATLPLGLVLLLPVLAAADQLYPWIGAPPAALPEVVRHKLAYLNLPFFTARFVVVAALWLWLAWRLHAWTAPGVDRRGHAGAAAGGLILHAVLISVLAIDWMMSLEPAFYSTIYPLLEGAGQALGAYATAIAGLAIIRGIDNVAYDTERATLGEDVCNLLFGLLLLWAYLAYMQWLIVWAGDLPHEIEWYLDRVGGGWTGVLIAVVALSVLAGLGLMNKALKRRASAVLTLAAMTLLARLLDVVWRIRPPSEPATHVWTDVAALLLAGGLWAALAIRLHARETPVTRHVEGQVDA